MQNKNLSAQIRIHGLSPILNALVTLMYIFLTTKKVYH
ncbi:hypothetical protein SAMN05216232_3809 [Virgibacillus subterraneus]|uniref:Uncharacterized protein n=2 Tax=Virgibacillus TaxID=84406 RepID=A0A1H1F1K6_9BACI|nr:hypothetical protein SAMN05216231_3162 [Virgibacillus salinus]SEQ95978.1 hypothetical protein SAMN05216232_3809 [Virgibacillus subterraneus]